MGLFISINVANIFASQQDTQNYSQDDLLKVVASVSSQTEKKDNKGRACLVEDLEKDEQKNQREYEETGVGGKNFNRDEVVGSSIKMAADKMRADRKRQEKQALDAAENASAQAK